MRFPYLTVLTFATALVVTSCSKKEEESTPPKKSDPLCFVAENYTDQLPNFSFENWGYPDSSEGKYKEPCGGVWTSTNGISTQINLTTLTQSTNAQNGTYAAKLTTVSVLGPIIGPAILFTGRFKTYNIDYTDILKNAELGVPFTMKPKTLDGYYSYNPVNSDSALASVLLTKYNTGTNARDTIGYGEFVAKSKVSAYTSFSVIIDYSFTNGTDIPDSILVMFASSKGIEGLKGETGSTLYVDNCGFKY
jgi:hypothetical protein